jgi:predicted metal-dependent enzyme (double-stranded beta helix superfamily)
MAQRLEIGKWVERLAAISRKEFTLPRVDEFLHASQIQPETLAPYLFYSRGHYTRNLIFKSDLFEVIAICWEVGQASQIHNHRDQNCWMAVPIGRLRVQNFRVEDRDAARGACKLHPTGTYDMDPEHPGTVQPEEPVHQVLNLKEFGQRATSIHIYSRPYSSCEVYSLDKGTYSDVPLHYSSEYGQLSPEEKLL